MSRTKVEDASRATEFMRPFLHAIGAWPTTGGSSFRSKLFHRAKHVLAVFLLLLVIVPCLLCLFFKEKSNKRRIKLVAPIVNTVMQFCKYTILLCRMKEMGVSLDEIQRDWIEATEENRQIYRTKANTARRMFFMVTFTMYAAGLCYRAILPILRGTIVTPDNVTIRSLPCPSYFVILDEQATPNYEIIFVLQVLAGIVAYAVLSGSCGICALLVLHACSMLRILVNKMNALLEGKDVSETVVQRRLKDIVKYQVKIKEFLKNIETITEYICLTELLGGTLLTCLGLQIILMEWEDGNTMAAVVFATFVTLYTFCIFILCYIGQLLVDENNDVGEASCTMNWYHLRTKHARYLILIIAISNSSMKLTAGKMLEMSLASFTDVVKVSMGYFNVLHSVV